MAKIVSPAANVKLRWSTRLAHLYRSMVRSSPLKAIPLDCRALANRLGCSYETLVRRTGDFAQGGRRTVWTFQGYGFIIFLRYRRHRRAKCGHPQFYVVGRQALHRIGGAPGKVRARLRQKTAAEWFAYLALIKKLAWGQFLKRRKRANDKHKASPVGGTGVGRLRGPPPTANRAATRFKKLACMLQGQYDRLADAPRADLHGWLVNRMRDEHDAVRIERCLAHAAAVMPRGRFEPVNPAAWVCAVATRHLEGDGLVPLLRKWDRLSRPGTGKARPGGRALKVEAAKTWRDAEGQLWQNFSEAKNGTDWRKIDG